jgi:hypothetical protein
MNSVIEITLSDYRQIKRLHKLIVLQIGFHTTEINVPYMLKVWKKVESN